jgi:hypothetical protein
MIGRSVDLPAGGAMGIFKAEPLSGFGAGSAAPTGMCGWVWSRRAWLLPCAAQGVAAPGP